MCLRCRTLEPNGRIRKCRACLAPFPKRRKPAHTSALKLAREVYELINGGPHCGICGATQKPGGKNLHRDHDHVTGRPRGILCWPCNSLMRRRVTIVWLRAALAYLENAERHSIDCDLDEDCSCGFLW
jgi:hypothetical protein